MSEPTREDIHRMRELEAFETLYDTCLVLLDENERLKEVVRAARKVDKALSPGCSAFRTELGIAVRRLREALAKLNYDSLVSFIHGKEG